MTNTYDIGDKITLRATFGVNVSKLRLLAPAGTTVLPVYDVLGYGDGDKLIINPEGRTREIVEVSSIDGVDITLTAGTLFDHEADEGLSELTDPTTVQIKHKLPDQTVVTYTDVDLVHEETGVYTKQISLADDGEHWYRIAGTGTVETAEERQFSVRPSVF